MTLAPAALNTLPPELHGRLLWTALTGEQRRHSLGDDLARRFHPDIGPLAAIREDTPECLAALGRLAQETGPLALMQPGAVLKVPGTETVKIGAGVRMVLADTPPLKHASEAVPVRLSQRDFPEMLELATLTAPGPFGTRTGDLGQFWGIRENGRLLAMAGRRITTANVVEVSGVCTHPDARGRGLAALLSRHVADSILAEGRLPILHAYSDNERALAIYRDLGFTLQEHVTLTIYAPVP
ncbi:GNAT family N-acetyltransferase [Novosphingobium sp. 9]|uniref:GNAT family N-acetyltransferase n=1 Tax=Novosphingobium sp. 9 TaxID=2025349 RepID=UPI0021B50803|nr:GNAT family N-acetyltransferase [Novosphingobium sp. 9]